jgi:hypothetical protein
MSDGKTNANCCGELSCLLIPAKRQQAFRVEGGPPSGRLAVYLVQIGIVETLWRLFARYEWYLLCVRASCLKSL